MQIKFYKKKNTKYWEVTNDPLVGDDSQIFFCIDKVLFYTLKLLFMMTDFLILRKKIIILTLTHARKNSLFAFQDL